MTEISHKGRVKDMTPKTTIVEFVQSPACSECHAKAMCGITEGSLKEIELPTPFLAAYGPGDEVEVCMSQTMGLKAVWISYVIPLAVLMVVVLALNGSGVSELWTGLSAVGAVALYYFVIFLLRNKLRNQYVFYIKQ